MKKILILLTMFLISACAFASDFEGIYDKYQVVYLPSSHIFSQGAMVEDGIVLTKKVSQGSGNYSEYYDSDGNMVMELGSDFEFITSDGRLIAVHNASLNFYEVKYVNERFIEVPLDEKEIQEIFKGAEIIKISQFKNNNYTLVKKPRKPKSFLLLNDTGKYFHKYAFQNIKKSLDIKGLGSADKYGNIIFAHYNDNSEEFPRYVIKVRLWAR